MTRLVETAFALLFVALVGLMAWGIFVAVMKWPG
jgi:hypothetical protein